MKICTKCDLEKAITEFHRDKSRKDGLANRCKPCVIAHVKQYYTNNRSKVIENVREWVARNRIRHNKKCAEWVKRNRGAVNARTARRYAAKTKATPSWAAPGTEEHWLVNEVYDLALLRSKLTGVPYEVDHVFPLRGGSVSGLHVPMNLRVIPKWENRRKSNKIPVTS